MPLQGTIDKLRPNVREFSTLPCAHFVLSRISTIATLSHMAAEFRSRLRSPAPLDAQPSGHRVGIVSVIAIALMSGFYAACGATSVTNVAGPTARCAVALDAASHTVAAAGGII